MSLSPSRLSLPRLPLSPLIEVALPTLAAVAPSHPLVVARDPQEGEGKLRRGIAVGCLVKPMLRGNVVGRSPPLSGSAQGMTTLHRARPVTHSLLHTIGLTPKGPRPASRGEIAISRLTPSAPSET